MKLTKETLKKIIKEELESILSEVSDLPPELNDAIYASPVGIEKFQNLEITFKSVNDLMKKINRNLSLTTRPNEQFSINLGGSYGPENKPSLKITYSGNAQRDQDIGVEGLGSHVMVSDEILKQLRNLKKG